MTDAPARYVAAQLRGIVGIVDIEVTATSLSGRVKASQNRDAADRAGVVAGFEGEPEGVPMAAMVASARGCR